MDNKVGMSLWTIYGWNPLETVTVDMLNRIAAMGSQAVELVVDRKSTRLNSSHTT